MNFKMTTQTRRLEMPGASIEVDMLGDTAVLTLNTEPRDPGQGFFERVFLGESPSRIHFTYEQLDGLHDLIGDALHALRNSRDLKVQHIAALKALGIVEVTKDEPKEIEAGPDVEEDDAA